MDVGVAKKIGLTSVKFISNLVNYVVIVIIFLVVLFAVYAMWDTEQVYDKANAEQYQIYKPTVDDSLSFEQLKNINPEVFAWINVYGTNIDYPVAQGEYNSKYVNTSITGEYSLSGSIFLDSNNKKDFSDFNSIIYGHHMEKDAMFGSIDLFREKAFFDSHLYGNLFYDGKDHGLEFFAFVQTDAYDSAVYSVPVVEVVNQQEYLDNLLSTATFSRDVDVSVDDRILLLSTCSADSTNSRDILVAKITDELFSDPFYEEATNNGDIASVDGQSQIMIDVPGWLFIVVPVVLIAVIVIVIICKSRKKNNQRRNGKYGI